jgi:hypothetical protein
MGNQHSSARLTSVELELGPSTGPDPSVFRTHLPTPPASASTSFQHDLPTPPMSASMDPTPTSQTFSRIDYAPGPMKNLPPAASGVTARSRNMVRKLSTKARKLGEREATPAMEEPPYSAGPKAIRTLGGDIRSFETMIVAAESRMEGGLQTTRTAKASTFAAHRAKRSSISDGKFEVPFVAPTPFPIATTPATPLVPRPFHHRKTSSGSYKTHSPHRNGSIRSARRAEREWRAKVAALAAGGVGSSRSSAVELRGPVPPRRVARKPSTVPTFTPDPVHSRSASPGDDTIITPPHTTIETESIGKGTMAKTIRSNRSFETLGHHAHVPMLQVNINNSPLPPRNRLVSVPQSVSSFYFDPNSTSRVSTRPNSMAAGMLLSPGHVASTFEAPSPTSRRSQLPQFESFQASPTTAQSGFRAEPTSAANVRREHDWDSRERVDRRVSMADLANEATEPIKFNSLPATTYKIPPPRQTSGLTLDFVQIGDFQNNTPERLSNPSRTPKRASHQTPLQAQNQSPILPYSPTTAYLLAAPIEDLRTPDYQHHPNYPLNGYQTPRTTHPFAVLQDTYSPAPTPPSKVPVPPAKPTQSVWTKGSIDPCAATPPRAGTSQTHAQMHQQSRPSLAGNRMKRGGSSVPSVLKPRRVNTAPRQEILGTGQAKAKYDLEKERGRRREMGVDLTPGMEDGVRPPKSGLPMSVS